MPRYSATLLDHVKSPRNGGAMESPNVVGKASLSGRAARHHLPPCGARHSEPADVPNLWLRSVDCLLLGVDRDDSGNAIADCRLLTGSSLIDSLAGIPEEKQFCAHMAIEGLQDAITKLEAATETHGERETRYECNSQLSLCMIARDSARTLGACLNSIRPWVDEIVVVDTGSLDETPQIARHFGARVFEFAWCDDFSAARNESLKHARGEWLFWMDSDDTIDENNGRRLHELSHSTHAAKILGYVMQVHCPGPCAHGEADCTVVDHVKLFRNLPTLRFDFRIHEQVLPAIRELGGEVAWTDIHVVHSGSDQSPAGRQRKHARDLRILHLELDERPDHPFTLFNLGMTYADMADHQRAIAYLKRSIDVAAVTESHLRKAYALLVNSLRAA